MGKKEPERLRIKSVSSWELTCISTAHKLLTNARIFRLFIRHKSRVKLGNEERSHIWREKDGVNELF